MVQNKLYKIGEVSKLCNVPIKTLRYYDEISLLKPVQIDKFNGYRYYSCDQFVAILTIKHFKKAGFSLKEIKRLLGRENLDYNMNKIKQKCIELDDKINDLLRIKKQLKFFISDENKALNEKCALTYEIKYIPEVFVAYLKDKGGVSADEFSIRYCQLMSLIERNNLHTTKNVMAMYYDDFTVYEGEGSEQCNIEVCAQVSCTKEIPGIVRKFGGFKALSVMHYGSYDNMQDSYIKMINYIYENGYEISGPAIDNYIVDIVSTCDPNNYITELLIPIK